MPGQSSNDLATLALSGPVATLSLNRPEARNALSLDLLDALRRRVAELASRPDVSAVVLTGAGKAFCAGMDLRAVATDEALAAGMPLKLLTALADLLLALRALPQVIVARVHGAAIGGGCGLACVADIALTHADAKLGFPEVDLGVCPAVVTPWVVRKIGAGRARAVLLSGGVMSGPEALERGLVNRVTPTVTDLDAATAALAAQLARDGPGALRATKALLNDLDGSLDTAAARRGAELSAAVLAAPDAQRRLRQRLERA